MERYAEEYPVLQGGSKPKPAENKCVPNLAKTIFPHLSRLFTFTGTWKKIVSAEQEYALTCFIKESDPVIRQQIVVKNLRTVIEVAKRYTDLGLEFVELVHEGNQGFIHAMEHYEPESCLSFQAFVDRCICQSIEDAIISNSSKSDHRIAIPVSACCAARKRLDAAPCKMMESVTTISAI